MKVWSFGYNGQMPGLTICFLTLIMDNPVAGGIVQGVWADYRDRPETVELTLEIRNIRVNPEKGLQTKFL